MKNRKFFAFFVVLSLVLLAVFFSVCVRFNPSIGIIGGADGPTSIWVAKPF